MMTKCQRIVLYLVLAVATTIWVTTANAIEPLVRFGIGESIAIPVHTNGTWYDENLQHQFHTNSLAFNIEAGLQFTPTISATIGLFHLGKNGVDSDAVSDDCFSRQCTDETPSKFHVVDKVRGLELGATYTFQTKPIQPYFYGGGFIGQHKLHVDVTPPESAVQHVDFSGRITGIVIGAGIKYKFLFAQVKYYQGAGGSAAPVSRRFVVPAIGVEYVW